MAGEVRRNGQKHGMGRARVGGRAGTEGGSQLQWKQRRYSRKGMGVTVRRGSGLLFEREGGYSKKGMGGYMGRGFLYVEEGGYSRKGMGVT